MAPSLIRLTIDVRGIVQGVGFRPTVHRLATAADLGGSVQNRSGTVRIVLVGQGAAVDAFVRALPASLPPNARLEAVTVVSREALAPGERVEAFRIVESEAEQTYDISIPADLAMCPDCAREILDPLDRRHGYPFTTCTRCGPRYTVVESMPYDRQRTTLSRFPLCPACRAEYEDPADRRFHAESTACPACGPSLTLAAIDGQPLPGDPIRSARRLLHGGKIVAVRGLGGFHLAVDALNRDAVRELRGRKARPHKPFAVMADSLATVREFCRTSREAETLLTSPQAPVVILDLADAAAGGALPMDLLTPDAMTLGVLLPTTPLHCLLMTPLPGDPAPPLRLLVMTSGNARGEPICISSAEAFDRLRGIADVVLTHDREINLRNDDSVIILQRGSPQLWRRARGYAPHPILLSAPLRRCVLATGAENKNTIALAWKDRVVPSPHIGDLDTPAAQDGFDKVMQALPLFLAREPESVAVDLHPDMFASLRGRQYAASRGIPVIPVQHHHAHAAACLAEHGCDEGLALAFDGTGLGPDGTIWGAELLECEAGAYRRLATFAPVPLPGGDDAVRMPARQLIGRWHAAGLDTPTAWLERLGITAEQDLVWRAQCARQLNAPMTHAAGRMFDAVSALLGVAPQRITYEGQPAIRLESAARGQTSGGPLVLPYQTYERDGLFYVDWSELFVALRRPENIAGREAALAMAFHRAVASAAREMVRYALARTHCRRIALSGGVFMNRILNDLLVPELESLGLAALIHRQTPPGDGCIAIGQAVIAGRTVP